MAEASYVSEEAEQRQEEKFEEQEEQFVMRDVRDTGEEKKQAVAGAAEQMIPALAESKIKSGEAAPGVSGTLGDVTSVGQQTSERAHPRQGAPVPDAGRFGGLAADPEAEEKPEPELGAGHKKGIGIPPGSMGDARVGGEPIQSETTPTN